MKWYEAELSAAIEEDKTRGGFICDMSRYELDDHKNGYTSRTLWRFWVIRQRP